MVKFKNLRGSALIEFAIAVPMLCLILFGTVEYGVIMFDQSILINASREGARYAVVSQNSAYPTSAAVSSYIKTNYTTNLITFAATSPTPTISITNSASPAVAGAQLTLTVSYSYTPIVLNKLTSMPSPLTLTSSTIMAYE